ncbi:hypothetical protein P7H33_09270 [Vagococcus lutrae]|uniref:hypothetical protein n=1 Tax=Vagococcus lutrae TaxID=81947 RepID=UPI002096981C|nr:hypothetical protein [Vagococcus lutrae]MCO7151881.1 hypothetical protein [Vagococcus lutrae]MDT2813132.1 hypothetical protein [Vagococcus lutrae]
MIKKITSKNNSVFLFKDIPHKQRNQTGIASGESVLLSIYEHDDFYFTKDINLIKYDSIILTEEPTQLEIDFFNFMSKEKSAKYSVNLIKKYNISKYIHFLPRVKYLQFNENDNIIVRGNLTFKDSIYQNELPKIILNNEEIDLIDNSYFEYTLPKNSGVDILNFKLDFPKQTITRSYKIKTI